MPYFHISGIGFNCGYDKDNCPKNFESCYICVKKRLEEIGFELEEEFKVFEIKSDEKYARLEREKTWQKFLDVLNIKHIIIIDKDSGLSIINYGVSDVNIDAGLLSGFIQANITFSESEKLSSNKDREKIPHPFYEFQYQDFNILLINGIHVRVCLILDHKASDSMRTQLMKFIEIFEVTFKDALLNFQKSGEIDPDDMIELIIELFNINIVFPMSLSPTIPPYEVKIINRNSIQKAIYNLAKELLLSKAFFFVNNLIKKLKKIVNIDSDVILYEINQLIERKIIIPTNLETVLDKIETQEKANSKKLNEIKPISSITISNGDFEKFNEEIQKIELPKAKKLIKESIKKGKHAEKNRAYQIAHKEYNKALIIAKKFDLKNEVLRISDVIFKLENETKKVELHFLLEKAENFEKIKDYINSIHFYQKALKILETFLIFNLADADSQIKKLKKKIMKLREEI